MTTTHEADMATPTRVGQLPKLTEVNSTDASFIVFFLQAVASTSASCVGLQLASVKSTSALFGYAKSTEVAHTEAVKIGEIARFSTSGRAPSFW